MGRWVFAVPVPGVGRAFFVSCRPCLLLSFLPPIPPPPSPAGKGEIQGYFMQGASPLASPGQNPRGTGKGGEPRTRRGVCLVCRPPTPPLVYFFAPIPPPPSPAGKGEIQGYFMQGASPLASPGAEPGRHLHDQRFLFVYGGQCRQPRRGGTGGEELRRLRWSSPPGQG